MTVHGIGMQQNPQSHPQESQLPQLVLPGAIPVGFTIDSREAVGLTASTGKETPLERPCILCVFRDVFRDMFDAVQLTIPPFWSAAVPGFTGGARMKRDCRVLTYLFGLTILNWPTLRKAEELPPTHLIYT